VETVVATPFFVYTPEWVEERLAQENGLQLLVDRLNQASRPAREWQRKVDGTTAAVRGGDIRLPRQEPSLVPANVKRCATRTALQMAAELFGSSKSDQAKAVNDLIETVARHSEKR
jgi:hypothetical protein